MNVEPHVLTDNYVGFLYW